MAQYNMAFLISLSVLNLVSFLLLSQNLLSLLYQNQPQTTYSKALNRDEQYPSYGGRLMSIKFVSLSVRIFTRLIALLLSF